MRHTTRTRRLLATAVAAALLVLTVALWPRATQERTIKAAFAKGGVIGTQMLSISTQDRLLWNLALNDPLAGGLLRGKQLDLLRVHPVGAANDHLYATCDRNCVQVTFYNYSDGGTIDTVFNRESAEFVAAWADQTARPNPSPYVVERVVDIAAADRAVTDVLGDIRRARALMIPMSIWLADNACKDDWCVDLTFHDPASSGQIFHVVVNMTRSEVARTFYSRSRDDRFYQSPVELDENAPLFTDGCREQADWEVCWEMTPNDGVNFFDARYDDQLIFTSAKIGQIEAYYPSWPGGYRDEVGYASTVPPKFDTRVTEFADGFEVRQLFTEPFNWPNCICCYRYEQYIRFYSDGSFTPGFVSQGPGCEDLSEYRPFWRINMALDGATGGQPYAWAQTTWEPLERETDMSLYEPVFLNGERLVLEDANATYRLIPERSDPLGLDSGRLFLIDNEGDGPIMTGPADTYQPPRQWIDDEALTAADSDVVLWYVPILKTKKGDPWWCMPDPAPEVSPCHAQMAFERGAPLAPPTAEELAALAEMPTVSPQLPATPDPALEPTRRPTPRPVMGTEADEIILNAGCGACHHIGERGETHRVGPSLNNIGSIAGTRVPGQSADEYLYNSIIYPNIHISPDCPTGPCLPNIMPGTYFLTLSDEQINTLVSYLLTLREDVGTPATSIGSSAPVDGTPQPGTAGPSDTAPAAGAQVPGWVLAALGGVIALLAAILIWLLRRPRAASGATPDGD